MTAEELRPSRQRLVIGVVLAIVLVGIVLAILDWTKVRGILGQTDWRRVSIALLFTGVSYVCLSLGFAVTDRIFGIRMAMRDLLEVGFVSVVLNHLLSAGGAAGYSVRFLLMGAQGVTLRDILAASLFNSYLDTLGMLGMLPIGLVYLYLKHPLRPAVASAVGVGAVVVIVIFLLASALVFSGRARGPILRVLSSLARLVTRHDFGPAFLEFDGTMARGVRVLRRRPLAFALLISLVLIDWTCSLIALWFCFDALGDPLGLGPLIAGFAISVTAGVLSMVPGGFGVQEGSMAGLYALLGAPLEQAALAAVLFRAVYYLIPFAVSLGFYWRLLRRVGKANVPDSHQT